jgi:RNA 3'-terminal phosphate cyclase (ATP)
MVALVANLPLSIARREVDAAAEILDWERTCFRAEATERSPGPGNVASVFLESEHVTEVFTAFGAKGVRAEEVGRTVAREAKAYLDAGVPVGEHLADQLLLLMALAGSGSFRTVAPSSHTRTQIDLLSQVLAARVDVRPIREGAFEIDVARERSG